MIEFPASLFPLYVPPMLTAFSRVTCEGPPKVTTTTRRTTTTSTARPTTPDPDPCTFGAACDGCGVTTEFQGQVGRAAEGYSRTVGRLV